MLSGFAMMLASLKLQFTSEDLVTLITAIGAISTAIAAAFSAKSAKTAELVANRWEKEVRHQMIVETWRKLECASKDTKQSAQDLSPLIASLGVLDIMEAEANDKNEQVDPDSILRELIRCDDSFKDCLDTLLTRAEDYRMKTEELYEKALTWHTVERSDTKEQVLERVKYHSDLSELILHFAMDIDEAWASYNRATSIFSDKYTETINEKSHRLRKAINMLPETDLVEDAKILYDLVTLKCIPTP